MPGIMVGHLIIGTHKSYYYFCSILYPKVLLSLPLPIVDSCNEKSKIFWYAGNPKKLCKESLTLSILFLYSFLL
jgi:hypothetical protein